MGISLCSSGSYEKSALAVGIWSFFSSIAQLIFMRWQMADANERSARAAISTGQVYYSGRYMIFDDSRYKYNPDAQFYRALYITQSICIFSELFLLLASALLLLAVCIQKRFLIWPWFACMTFSVFATLGNCFALWFGGSRVSWLQITMLHLVLVLTHIYCVRIMAIHYYQTSSISNQSKEIDGNEMGEDGIDVSSNHECQFEVSSCFCCSRSNATLTVGIWSFVYGILSFVLFGWQTIVMIQCRALILSMDRFHCVWECPCVEKVKKQTFVFIDVIFLIQIVCLMFSFLLILSSCALVYGIKSKSENLVFQWFPSMIFSMLASLIYCILWWCGDVRDYWTAITVVLTIGFLMNGYCVVVAMKHYGDITSKKEITLEERQNLENLLKSDDKNTCSTPPPEYHLVADPNQTGRQYPNRLISLEN